MPIGAPAPSPLDGNQVLQHAFIDATGELRVSATLNPGGTSEVIISHEDDSIRLGDGTSLVTVTVDGSKVGLDTNIQNFDEMVTNDGSGNPITSTLTEVTKRGLDVISLNEIVPREFDDIEITSKNAAGDPLIVVYRSNSVTVATLNITYDVDGDLERVQRS